MNFHFQRIWLQDERCIGCSLLVLRTSQRTPWVTCNTNSQISSNLLDNLSSQEKGVCYCGDLVNLWFNLIVCHKFNNTLPYTKTTAYMCGRKVCLH